MYQYKYDNMKITIMLEHVTSVYYNKHADTFDFYLTDNDEPNEIPSKFYDSFMDKLSSYVKSQAQ